MTNYQTRKAAARDAAIVYQQNAAEQSPSWGEIAEATAYFERLGRRFGLLREFRENGII